MNLATLPGLLAVLHALAGIGVHRRAVRPLDGARRRGASDDPGVDAPRSPGRRAVRDAGHRRLAGRVHPGRPHGDRAEGLPLLGPFVGAGANWLFVSLLLFLSVLPLVPLVFLPRGRVFEAALEEAEAAGVVTDRLRAAWSDPVVRGAHIYELTAVTIVLVLMLAKPF